MLSGKESGFAVGLDDGLFEGGEEPGVPFGSSGVVAVGGSDRPGNAGEISMVRTAVTRTNVSRAPITVWMVVLSPKAPKSG